MKNILILLPSLGQGGAEKIHIDLANSWSDIYKVTLVTLFNDQALRDNLNERINFKCLNTKSIFRALLPILRAIKKDQPDFIVPAMWPLTSISIIAKLLSGVKTKIFPVEHCFFNKYAAKDHGLPLMLIGLTKLLTYVFANKVICVSKGTKDSIRAISFLPNKLFKVIYNGINLPETDFIDKESLYKTSDKVLISVGRLSHPKDYFTTIDAIKLINDDNVKLYIFGDGPDKKKIDSYITQNGLRDRIFIMGFKNNINDYMRAADLFVHSSKYESFCIAALEAMSCGLPIVATDSPTGLSEILDNGRYGKLVQVGNPNDLASAISDSLENNLLSKDELVSRAMHFSFTRTNSEYIKLFN